MLREAVEQVRSDHPTVTVETAVIQGPPARVLVDLSADADLLVIGSRGRGGFSGLLLGSVSQQCVHHAHCPVTVVR
jgi:nucleotide-binding universal stress UspA family protein